MATYSRGGLSSRYPAHDDHVQLRVDPIQGDLDDEIHGLHSKVAQLKNIAQVIGQETMFQNEIINQLETTMQRAQAGIKSAVKKINKSIVQNGSNHLMHVIIFAMLFFTVVYLWSKLSR